MTLSFMALHIFVLNHYSFQKIANRDMIGNKMTLGELYHAYNEIKGIFWRVALSFSFDYYCYPGFLFSIPV